MDAQPVKYKTLLAFSVVRWSARGWRGGVYNNLYKVFTLSINVTLFFKRQYLVISFHQYCHYVAGLVGVGLSRLFSASKLEDKIVGEDKKLSNSMGLFLQKTNVIRDYLEDIREQREFWPKEVKTYNIADCPDS